MAVVDRDYILMGILHVRFMGNVFIKERTICIILHGPNLTVFPRQSFNLYLNNGQWWSVHRVSEQYIEKGV